MNYDAINSLIGQEWKYIDNDCFAVFRKASKLVFGRNIEAIALPEISSTEKNLKIFRRSLSGEKWRKVDTPSAGDAVFFLNKNKRPHHIGIYIEYGHVLHCPGTVKNPMRTVYEKIKDMNPILYPYHEFYAPCL